MPCERNDEVCPEHSNCEHMGPGLHDCNCHVGYNPTLETTVICIEDTGWQNINGQGCAAHPVDGILCTGALPENMRVPGMKTVLEACCDRCPSYTTCGGNETKTPYVSGSLKDLEVICFGDYNGGPSPS